jgi:tetratricopeptide (TPR) repeat protein
LVSALGQVAGWRIVVCSGEAAQRGLGEDAATIVRGAILRSGATFRVTVNIVSAPDGCLLASQRFDRHENDGYELQQEVIRYVLARLIGAANPTSDDSEGFHRYLQGRYLMNQGTPEALQKAVRCFQQIVEREAHSSRAWAGLAAALNTMLLLGAADPAVAVPQAERAAAKALEGEPDLPEAKTAHAMAMVLSGDTIANARRTLESVIQAHPHFVPARIAYAAHCLLPSGDVASAKQQVEIAIGADPSNPSALYLLSLVQYAELQYDEARQTLEAILRISPDYPACWLQLAEIHRRAGNGREALTAYDRFEKLSPAPRAARIISNAAAESGAPDSPLAATGLPRRRAAGSTVGF